MIGVLLALFVLAMILWSLLKGLGVVKSGPNFGDPKATVALTLAVFNLVVWGMIPWFWDILTYQWYVVILFNLGLGAFLYLSKADPKKLAGLVGGALVVGLLTTAYYKFSPRFKAGETIGAVAKRQSGYVSVETAKRVVCECESGCRQFEDDGKTPYKNRGIPDKGIKPSSAFGKYQFLEIHREPAAKLGFDLDTEEGQDGYFEYLYLREGFGPWDHDEQYGGGRVCREPKLLALGLDPDFNEVYPKIKTIIAPTDKFSDGETIKSGVYFDWGDSEGEFVVRDQKGSLAVFQPNKGIMENLPYPSTILFFRSLGDKPVTVKLKLGTKPLVRM